MFIGFMFSDTTRSVGRVLVIFLMLWARRWINHWSLWCMAAAAPDLWLPSHLQAITNAWPVQYYTAWWQRHMCANSLPKAVKWKCNDRDFPLKLCPIFGLKKISPRQVDRVVNNTRRRRRRRRRSSLLTTPIRQSTSRGCLLQSVNCNPLTPFDLLWICLTTCFYSCQDFVWHSASRLR